MELFSSYHNLKKYCYFSNLPDSTLKAISKKFRTVEFPAGTEIVREGELADTFYLVHSGEIEISMKTHFNNPLKISIKGQEEALGDMQLLTCSSRIKTIKAKTFVVLFSLLKADFEEIVHLHSTFSLTVSNKINKYMECNKVRDYEPFAHIDSAKVHVLLERFEERLYSPGENIIKQGEKGDNYFIIKTGRVKVLKKMLGDNPELVAILSVGQAFGEEALITGSPRSATVQAIDQISVWTLCKADFDQIIKTDLLEEVSPKDVLIEADENHYLDVRMQMEFNEEHIKDAINIPLDDLRTRYSELDKSKEYYVYCLLGARSASASFLLRSRGFKAKSIKGGILNWPGPLEGRLNHDGIQSPNHSGVSNKPFKPT